MMRLPFCVLPNVEIFEKVILVEECNRDSLILFFYFLKHLFSKSNTDKQTKEKLLT